MATTNERSDLDFIAELEKYISNESSNEILEKDPFFYHEEALQAFKNFKEFGKDKEASFYEDRRKDFKTYKEKSNDKIKEKSNGKTKYVNFLDSLKRDSDEFLIFELMGKLLAHFFDKAANKKVWNPNGEVFAAAQHNDAWVDTLLQYKESDNNFSKLKPSMTKNAIIYIEDPKNGLTLLSEDQRKEISNKVLDKKEYDADHFVESLLDHFKGVDIPLANLENRNYYISRFLFDPEIKSYWHETVTSNNKETINKKSMDETSSVINANTSRLNTIFYGPPGTGKTHKLIKIKEKFDEKKIKFVTFHPSYSYEDFVEGIKPVLVKQKDEKPVLDAGKTDAVQYMLVDGVFKEICLKASEDLKNKYAIFIDEINRGNIPSIFGELITLIEDDKRMGMPHGLSPDLPYSKKPFQVPPNLYIYGTMNTADRSVEALDVALRRRFVFEEIEPDKELIDCKYKDVDVKKIFETINQRIEVLLGKDYRIGHSYFMGEKVNSLKDLKDVFQYEIIPLLKEYFYEDWEKLCLVLGRKFVIIHIGKSEVTFSPGYEDTYEDYKDKNIYRISDPDTWNQLTFKSIYEV